MVRWFSPGSTRGAARVAVLFPPQAREWGLPAEVPLTPRTARRVLEIRRTGRVLREPRVDEYDPLVGERQSKGRMTKPGNCCVHGEASAPYIAWAAKPAISTLPRSLDRVYHLSGILQPSQARKVRDFHEAMDHWD